MEGSLPVIVGLLGGSYALFSTLMKLRQEIDDRRDFALGLKKDGRELHKDFRLYILRKDVMERCVAMALLMASVGITSAGASIYIWGATIKVDTYLTWLLFIFGLSCLIGSVCTTILGYCAYKRWKDYFNLGVWHGKKIDIVSIPEKHAEPDGATGASAVPQDL